MAKSKAKKVPQEKSKAGKVILIISIAIFCIFILPALLFMGLIGLIIATSDSTVESNGNVAHLHVNGVILTEASSSIFDETSDTSSRKFVDQIQHINEDANIDAVLIEINSPGGSGVASSEIAQAIQTLEVPVVSYIREVGASGSYWVASSTDHIFANRFSTVGSIGVIASYLDFSEFIKEYNVSYQRFVAGENKDFGTPFRKVTPQQEARYQEILDQLHEEFIKEVAVGRDMSYEEVKALADGSIYTGMEAVQNGLIDEIGTKQDAIWYLEDQLGKSVTLVEYTHEPSFLEVLAGYSANQFYAMGLGIGENMKLDASTGAHNPLIRT